MSLPKTFSSGERLFASDLNDNFDYLDNGYRYAGTRYYTSSGTFAKADPLGTGDIGLRAIRVRLVGGGGAGGGAQNTPSSPPTNSVGSGGGGGGYSEEFILASALSSSETVTVGAGGTGVNVADGNAGGTSSFGSYLSATGGAGGVYTAREQGARPQGAGGVGGSGSGGDVNIDGGQGVNAFIFEADRVMQCGGGDSVLGRGSVSKKVDRNGGENASEAGGGGSGGASGTSQGLTRAGGNGFRGLVIVECFV